MANYMAQPFYNFKAVQKVNSFLDDFDNENTHLLNLKIFLIPFSEEFEYNIIGNELNLISNSKKGNFLVQKSDYGFHNNLNELDNDSLDIFLEIIFNTIEYEKYLNNFQKNGNQEPRFVQKNDLIHGYQK